MTHNPVPEKGEFLDWLGHPVTTAFRTYLLRGVAVVQERWVSGYFRGDIANAEALANAQTLRGLANLTYEELLDGLKEEEK